MRHDHVTLVSVLLAYGTWASDFCKLVHDNRGCSPTCGYKWSAKEGKCAARETMRSAYCYELIEPAHRGCSKFCQYKWSEAHRACVVNATLPILSTPTPPPNASDHVATARWMASSLAWGVLSTISTRTTGSTIGDAFGNPNSFADVGGVPYIYGSAMDSSFVDLFAAGGRPRASLALSEASLMDKDGIAQIIECKIGADIFGDPENPPCARLVFSGTIVRLNASDPETAPAKAALFSRHPSFKLYPAGHDFFVAKLTVDGIWLINAYGGASIIDPAEYFNGSAATYRPTLDVTATRVNVPGKAAVSAVKQRARKLPHAKTARTLVSELTWGVLSTVSTRDGGATVGDAFGNPYSFADVNGVPYLFATDMDASMQDIFGNQSTRQRASLALSEASLPGNHSIAWKEKCQIGTLLGDPENPPCARLVLSGNLTKVSDGSAEKKTAMVALIARHPSFKSYPASHDFFVAKLAVDSIWLIAAYGGASIVAPADYFNAGV